MALKWTKPALRSVDGIAGLIAKDNPTRATSFVLELKDAVTKLQVHPGMGRAGRVTGTRERVLHHHCIAIYRVRSIKMPAKSCERACARWNNVKPRVPHV